MDKQRIGATPPQLQPLIMQTHQASSAAGSSFASSSIPPSNRPTIAQHHQHQQLPLEKRINPHGLPPQMLTGYEQLPMETLCTLGKELVLELMTRMFSIVSILKLNIKGENKPTNKPSGGVDNVDAIRLQLEYSQLVFAALTEIRLRIDLKLYQQLEKGQMLREARPSDDELIQLLSDPSPPEEDPKRAEMAAQFEQNRQCMIQLSSQLKKLEWLAANSDPSALLDSEGGSGAGSSGRRKGDERRS